MCLPQLPAYLSIGLSYSTTVSLQVGFSLHVRLLHLLASMEPVKYGLACLLVSQLFTSLSASPYFCQFC
jgi:hypothetical protein